MTSKVCAEQFRSVHFKCNRNRFLRTDFCYYHDRNGEYEGHKGLDQIFQCGSRYLATLFSWQSPCSGHRSIQHLVSLLSTTFRCSAGGLSVTNTKAMEL